MLGLAAPRLLCLRQTCSTLKGTATAHRTRYMRDPCSLKDAQRCEKKHETNAKECEEMRRNAKKCEETQRNAKKRKETQRNVKKREEM
jgi:hypothetical protein